MNGNVLQSLKFTEVSCRGCSNVVSVRRTLSSDCQFPAVFVLGVSWNTANATSMEIESVLKGIPLAIDLASVFGTDHNGVQRHDLADPVRRLKGLIAYYGRHFVALFASNVVDLLSKQLVSTSASMALSRCFPQRDEAHGRVWHLFDDARVKPMSKYTDTDEEAWNAVKRFMVAGRLQPFLVFYEVV